MNRKILQRIETFLFLFLNLSIFYAGADHPVPKGFFWLVLWIVTVSALQYVYLEWFLRKICQTEFLRLHLVLYLGIGIISLFYLMHGRADGEYGPLILLVLGVCILYGFVFYIVNRWLAHKFLR